VTFQLPRLLSRGRFNCQEALAESALGEQFLAEAFILFILPRLKSRGNLASPRPSPKDREALRKRQRKSRGYYVRIDR